MMLQKNSLFYITKEKRNSQLVETDMAEDTISNLNDITKEVTLENQPFYLPSNLQNRFISYHFLRTACL